MADLGGASNLADTVGGTNYTFTESPTLISSDYPIDDVDVLKKEKEKSDFLNIFFPGVT